MYPFVFAHEFPSLFLFLPLCFLRSALWLLYGIVVRDTPMMVVNAVGTVLQSAYFIIFYVYTSNKVSGKWDGGRGG